MKLTTICCLFLLPLYVGSQSYDLAIGMRVGTEWGATAQVRLPQIHKNFVLEGIVHQAIGKDEGSVTLLGKQHQPILSRRINLFYGLGAHAGWNNDIDVETGQTFNGPIGLDGTIGLEATFNRINVSYDYKPAINIRGGESVLYTQTAVSVRYVLGKRYSIWDKDKEKKIRKRRNQKRRDQRREERARSGNRWYEIWKKPAGG
ncbi:hypothetical protein CLV84_3650 [Neolewinella xylanilytica]|uniref:Outer membrane protein with beta-barrel domain n=1 Tax=Neolewinella xylanilytica TaxID=1514080 RepID=A0A2S6I6B7_9BACT|nr:hypothetical protein [Neolewinella xylanilytica]PPK86714.1 hypothetical protein CLV84_3650 [Neolewinella xylanilytica]